MLGKEAVVYTNQDVFVVWIRLNVTRYVKRVVLFLPQSVTVSGWPCWSFMKFRQSCQMANSLKVVFLLSFFNKFKKRICANDS